MKRPGIDGEEAGVDTVKRLGETVRIVGLEALKVVSGLGREAAEAAEAAVAAAMDSRRDEEEEGSNNTPF